VPSRRRMGAASPGEGGAVDTVGSPRQHCAAVEMQTAGDLCTRLPRSSVRVGLGGRRGVAGDRVGFPLRTSTGRAAGWSEGLPRPAQ
jgi:hypothetical protein